MLDARGGPVVVLVLALLLDLLLDLGRVHALVRLVDDEALRAGRHLLRDLVPLVLEEPVDAFLLVPLVPVRRAPRRARHLQPLHGQRLGHAHVAELRVHEHARLDALLDGLGHVHDHLAAALVVLAGAAALLVALALLQDRRAELARLRLHRGAWSGHALRDARCGLLLGSHARPAGPQTFLRCTGFEVSRA